MSPQPLFLCVYVPEFAAQARLRHRPAMRSEAVAILDGTPPLQTVYSTTRRARAMGVVHGTTRAELEAYPGITALLRSEPEERSAATALLAMLWNFSPRAEVLGLRSGAHRLVLDISGTERMFGTPMQLARSVSTEAQSLGLSACCATSQNFHAAVCAARYAGALPCVIAPGSERDALAALPLEALDTLTQEQQEVFTLWGLRTLADIAALPETELIARMGQPGKRLRLLALGKHPHLLQPEQECFAMEEHTSFDTPVEMLDSLLFVLSPMLDQLVQRATMRALALASITVRLDLTNHAAEGTAEPQEVRSFTRTVTPALPLVERRVLLKLLHLELQAHPPGAPVTAVHLHAETGDPARAQLGIFSPQLPEPSRLDVTLARIRALVGDGRVGRPRLLDNHREESFAMERFTVSDVPERSCIRKKQAAVHGTWQKPAGANAFTPTKLAMRRVRPPVRLHMRLADAKPQRFLWGGVQFDVETAYGPWRQSGNWWSSSAWSQEEWDVMACSSDGGKLACRIVRDLLQQQWRLEGLYD